MSILSLCLGLTWQDDITQQVVSRELSGLRSVPLRHQTAAPNSLASFGRSRQPRPLQAQLSRNLQQYLTGLGFMPQSEFTGEPGVQREGADTQVNCHVLSRSVKFVSLRRHIDPLLPLDALMSTSPWSRTVCELLCSFHFVLPHHRLCLEMYAPFS